MPQADEGFPWWLLLIGVIVVLMFVDSCPDQSADTELARTAHEAVQLARESQSDDRSAVLWTGRFRLLAQVIGVSVPLVVAYLIWRSSCKSEIDAAEIIETAEQYALPNINPHRPPDLPADPLSSDVNTYASESDSSHSAG